jgi:UPF0716 protein FxsA
MFRKLILLFIIVPLIELIIILKVGSTIGFLQTLFSLTVMGVFGAYLAKSQGLIAIRRVQEQLNMGLMPGNELLDGLIILGASLLLITPGVLTDVCGIILLIPPARRLVREYLKKLLRKWLANGTITINHNNFNNFNKF